MLIPARQFSVSTDLNLQPIDNSANFLQQCIGPGFQLMWVPILMLIPARQFSVSTDLNLHPIDNSAKFLQQCIGNGFQLMWVPIFKSWGCDCYGLKGFVFSLSIRKRQCRRAYSNAVSHLLFGEWLFVYFLDILVCAVQTTV